MMFTIKAEAQVPYTDKRVVHEVKLEKFSAGPNWRHQVDHVCDLVESIVIARVDEVLKEEGIELDPMTGFRK